MAYRFRLIVVAFFSFVCFNSLSAIPLSSGIYTHSGDRVYNIGPFSDYSSACAVFYSYRPPAYANSVFLRAENTSSRDGIMCSGTVFYRMPDSSVKSFSYVDVWYALTTKPACPANSTVSGSQCSCNEGYEEKNGNSCEKPKEPDACESLSEKCETLKGSKSYIVDLPMSKSQFKQFKPFTTCTPAGLVPGCNRGCVVSSSGFGGLNTAQDGSTFFHGEGTITSGTCLPSSPSSGSEEPDEGENPLPPSEPDDKPCKSGEYQGTVNGTKVCLPAKTKEEVIKQETVVNNDNSKTEVATTVSCEGGKCTVTETATNKDSTGATTGTASKETGITQSNFCAQNPGSAVCKSAGEDGQDDKSTFTGSCASNFKCEGDSVQCAIALEQHNTSCKLFDESNPYWQAFKDAEAGNSTGVESTAVDLASHVSVDSVIGAGVCPADIEVVVFNQTIPFAVSKFCPYFDAMGMLIMLGAAVGCLRILGSG